MKLLHCALFIINGVSVLTMAQICIDQWRVLAVHWPIKYRMSFESPQWIIFLASTWLFASVIVLPYFYIGYIDYLKIFSFVTVAIAFVSLISASIICKSHLNPKVAPTSVSSTSESSDNGLRRIATIRLVLRRHFIGSLGNLKIDSTERRVYQSFLIMLVVFLGT